MVVESANKFKGTVKAYRSGSKLGSHEYTVILFRGEESDLLEKLQNDISNLVTFCDNGFKFDDNITRHYGGNVRTGWITEKYNQLTKSTIQSFSTGSKPSPESKRAYKVEVYYD